MFSTVSHQFSDAVIALLQFSRMEPLLCKHMVERMPLRPLFN